MNAETMRALRYVASEPHVFEYGPSTCTLDQGDALRAEGLAQWKRGGNGLDLTPEGRDTLQSPVEDEYSYPPSECEAPARPVDLAALGVQVPPRHRPTRRLYAAPLSDEQIEAIRARERAGRK